MKNLARASLIGSTALADDEAVCSPKTGDQSEHYISDAQIAQLVSVALENALDAIGQADPETFLRLRAFDARKSILELHSALQKAGSRDEAMLQDCRMAIGFQNIALDLALNLATSIRRYAKTFERKIPSAAIA